MNVVDESHEEDLSQVWAIAAYGTPAHGSPSHLELPVEKTVKVVVNGRHAMTLTCTPSDIVELVLGRLYSEGFIDGADDVETLRLCHLSAVATVELVDRDAAIDAASADDVPTCCTDTRNLVEIGTRRALEPLPDHPVDAQEILQMVRHAQIDSPLHKATYGVHSCTIFRDGAELGQYEDLGRHNALDKAIGSLLLRGIPAETVAAYSTGRVPVDMVRKAIRARIPLLMTKAVPTTESVLLARRYGLTLVGKADGGSFRLFSGHLAQ